MSQQSICIVALGANTPIGRYADSAAAAVRAGINRFSEHPFMIDTAGEPMRVSRAAWLDIDSAVADRFAALLLPVLDQGLAPLLQGAGRELKVALLLGLPAPRPGLPAGLERALTDAAWRHWPRQLVGISCLPSGHAAGLVALGQACELLLHSACAACLVAGVDSYLQPETLEWLEHNDQLHSAGPLNNAWGFIPGEAAGAVLIMKEESAAAVQRPPLARLLGLGTGREDSCIKTQTVCTGQGLTQAFRQALAGLPAGALITDIYGDLNGEPYRADEYGFACLRTKEAFESASSVITAADCWGDVGAATGPLCLGLAALAGQRAYARGPRALVWSSSEGGERGAALLQVNCEKRE